MSNGGEFELSQEVLAALPADPYEQLDVARRIMAMAVSSRMSKLESETGKLRQKLAEKEHVIHGLQKRVAISGDGLSWRGLLGTWVAVLVSIFAG